jgi:hypothetical protein
MKRKQRLTLADAAPILEQVHQAVGELMNEALDDVRKMEKTGLRRIGVPYSLQPDLILKFERIIGRKLTAEAELKDVRDVQFFTSALLDLLRAS